MSSAGAFVTVIFILIVAAIVFHLRKDTNHDILESSFTKLVVALIVATILVLALVNSLPKSSEDDPCEDDPCACMKCK